MKISQVILIVLAGLTVTISCSDNPSNISDGLPQTAGKTHVLGYIDEFETKRIFASRNPVFNQDFQCFIKNTNLKLMVQQELMLILLTIIQLLG